MQLYYIGGGYDGGVNNGIKGQVFAYDQEHNQWIGSTALLYCTGRNDGRILDKKC